MSFNDLPVEVVVCIFRNFAIEDLDLLVGKLPDYRTFLLYIKYSQPILTTSKCCCNELQYLIGKNVKIHPQRVIIDSQCSQIKTLLPFFMDVGCKITIKVTDTSLKEELEMLSANNYQVDMILDVKDEVHVPEMNVNYVKITGDNFNIPSNLTNIKHVDLSFNGLTDCQLANIQFPSSIETLNLSHNSFSVMSQNNLRIQHLSGLKSLDLSNNDIIGFCINLNSLTSLKHLDLKSNLLFNVDDLKLNLAIELGRNFIDKTNR